MLGLKTCQDLSIINVHHITRRPETDILIKEYADVFKGLRKGRRISYKPTPEHQTSYPPRKVPLKILPKLNETLNKLIPTGH